MVPWILAFLGGSKKSGTLRERVDGKVAFSEKSGTSKVTPKSYKVTQRASEQLGVTSRKKTLMHHKWGPLNLFGKKVDKD